MKLLYQSIENVTDFFDGQIREIPLFENGKKLPPGVAAVCRYDRGYIAVAGPLSVEDGLQHFLEHELIHWMERDMDVYFDGAAYPNHMLHLMYHGDWEKERLYDMCGDIERARKLCNRKDIKGILESVDISPDRENILSIETILNERGGFNKYDHKLNFAFEFLDELYNNLTAIYLAERCPPKKSVEFLEGIHKKSGIDDYDRILEVINN